MKALEKVNDNLLFLELNVFDFKYRYPLICNYLDKLISNAFSSWLLEAFLELDGNLPNGI